MRFQSIIAAQQRLHGCGSRAANVFLAHEVAGALDSAVGQENPVFGWFRWLARSRKRHYTFALCGPDECRNRFDFICAKAIDLATVFA